MNTLPSYAPSGAHRQPPLPRRFADVVVAQLTGIAALQALHRCVEAAPEHPSREQATEQRRRAAVREQQRLAAEERTQRRLVESGEPLQVVQPLRALVAHRQEWFRDRAAETLLSFGVDVVGRCDNGATAVGIAAAEQPDVVLLSDVLSMQSCDEVIADLRAVSPSTLIGVQGPNALRLAELLEIGADVMFGAVLPEKAAHELVGAMAHSAALV